MPLFLNIGVVIKKLSNGRWHSRIQIPTARRNKAGRIIYRGIESTFSTKGAAEARESQQRKQFGMTGSEGTLTISEVAEYRKARLIARGNDLAEVAQFWAVRHPEHQMTVVSAIDHYRVKEVAKIEKSTEAGLKSKLQWLEDCFGEMGLQNVELKYLREEIQKLPLDTTTVNGYMRVTKRFFGWCCEAERGWLEQSPANHLKQSKDEPGAVEYLSVVDANTPSIFWIQDGEYFAAPRQFDFYFREDGASGWRFCFRSYSEK